ncbi:protein FAM83G [Discoglossus pictus]
MALSQIQCLDNNNVNWRSSETKPEFFYSEEQRMALEALVSKGEEAFYEVIKRENIRDFLSDLELGKIVDKVEPFDPDAAHQRNGSEKSESEEEDHQGGTEHSLEYWPERSDCSIPDLDLGWPDTVAYRGVTRATVYMQPPIDGQPHIKEVVRKMVTQAQRVIAVVMDLFTDVDIFKDMLDAGFKRKVSVYIILSEQNVKYFLQMCEKTPMHKGHLKNLRVRSIGGSEFYTRFSTKFKGSLGQKFMFVDGDKAVCGSYSFTWSAARIDRNLVTVLSGQVVETFDRQFQDLYLQSKGVSLKCVPMENEPEPEPVAQPAAMPAAPSESIARKLINPKYALVTVKSPSDKDTASEKSKKENTVPNGMKIKKAKPVMDHQADEQHIHPALQDMEKANMFDYLPTWAEPDPEPGSDILGYINIIDPKIKNAQLSQMNRIKICDTSHATAQFMLQSKEQESKNLQRTEELQNGQLETSSHEKKEVQHHEKQSPVHSQSKIPLSRQASEDKESLSSTGKVEPEPSSLNEDLIKHPKEQTPEQLKSLNAQICANSFESLAGSHHLKADQKIPASVTANGPPVPKPRTVPVTDFITMKNTLNTQSHSTNMSQEENTVPSVNGVDAEGREVEDIDELIDNESPNNQDDDTDRFELCKQYSSSGSSSLPDSVASSMSEEYYPTTPLQRRGSDHISNGEHFPTQRKMSDGHISRGSFLSPLDLSQSMMEFRQLENGKRRNQALEEEIKRALNKNHQMQGKDHIYTMDSAQGTGKIQYGSNGPSVGYERFQQQDRNPGRGRPRKEGADSAGGYRQAPRKTEGSGGRHGYWSFKDYGGGYASQLSPSPVAADNTTSPLGIPYSKLSQTKHLKTKLGASAMDSKRRSHGPPGHKDL